ncbi:bleomycin hydrolase isoform X2 [Plutella xylostella]|uniref:bleomycin hydrolase isoform X2 n=1 Tax=Plutella xylostella TaxID=51655 RepID=UPI0020327226|nr:bleomycin hydrolase isoform X2 [Plutella xylostella]
MLVKLAITALVKRRTPLSSNLFRISRATMSTEQPLTLEALNKLRSDFYADPKNELAQNVCTRFDPFEVAISRKKADSTLHVYNIKIESEGKPVTNQESSGRCWLFAALNCMRLPFMKKYAIEEFEFSQSYLFFWDKVERCHYWLQNIVRTARAGEPLDGRLVGFLLKDPINDGGQWDMIVNLVNKYGVVPRRCFPDAFSSRRSLHMNAILKTKLREYAKELRDLVEEKATDEAIQAAISRQVAVIYNIVATCLGTPPEKFQFEFYNKEKAYHNFGMLTPQQFYETHVRPVFNVDDKVCLVSDPRASNPFGRLYTLHCLGNVLGGRQTAYNNQPIDTLMQVVKASISGNEAVWFGCEVSKRFERKNGLEDLDAHDYKLVFNTEVQVGLAKAARLQYGDSCMTHAMVFTAVGTDELGNPTKFRVENSYGDKEYDKGYLLMSAEWFREFVFEVVVDKKYVPAEVLEVFKQQATVLPAWDPMGTLACPLCDREC